jgi:hypothetical protein
MFGRSRTGVQYADTESPILILWSRGGSGTYRYRNSAKIIFAFGQPTSSESPSPANIIMPRKMIDLLSTENLAATVSAAYTQPLLERIHTCKDVRSRLSVGNVKDV